MLLPDYNAYKERSKMKKFSVVLFVSTLAVAVTLGLAWKAPGVGGTSDEAVSSLRVGATDPVDSSILGSPLETQLQSQEPGGCGLSSDELPLSQGAAFFCPSNCCNYVRMGNCCVSQTPAGCGPILCANYCRI